VASLSQGRTAAAQCGLFTHKSVPVIFEPPCILRCRTVLQTSNNEVSVFFQMTLSFGIRYPVSCVHAVILRCNISCK